MYKFRFPFLLVVTVLWVSIPFSRTQVIYPARSSFTLTASTDQRIRDVTQNFSLTCAFNTNLYPSQSSLAEVSRIRILKTDESDQWNLLATIRDNKVDVLYDNILGIGEVGGDIKSSYLKVTWPIVTASTFGRYRCEVLGFGTKLDYIAEMSNIVTLDEENNTPKDVPNRPLAKQNQFQHEMEIKMNEKLSTMNMKMNEKLESVNSENNERLKTMIQATDEKLKTLSMSMDEKLDSINEKLKMMTKATDEKLKTMNLSIGYKYEPWPEGTYSLLAPVTGCPYSSEWRKGFFKMHTESSHTPNSDTVSREANLPPYTRYSVGGQNFMILTYCSKITSTTGISWPSGSYCINKRGSCPAGFHAGIIDPDIEDTDEKSNQGGYFPNSNFHLHDYCCRSDGPASKAITLPTADPFILYRFKGRCQTVAKMHLSTGSVQIDTEDSNNLDKYQTSYHPDGRINPIIMEFCHYRPL